MPKNKMFETNIFSLTNLLVTGKNENPKKVFFFELAKKQTDLFSSNFNSHSGEKRQLNFFFSKFMEWKSTIINNFTFCVFFFCFRKFCRKAKWWLPDFFRRNLKFQSLGTPLFQEKKLQFCWVHLESFL